jgi:hypothetical protein
MRGRVGVSPTDISPAGSSPATYARPGCCRSGDLRRDHNLRDDNDRLGWGRRQAQNGGSPDGGPMVRTLLPPAASPMRT